MNLYFYIDLFFFANPNKTFRHNFLKLKKTLGLTSCPETKIRLKYGNHFFLRVSV